MFIPLWLLVPLCILALLGLVALALIVAEDPGEVGPLRKRDTITRQAR